MSGWVLFFCGLEWSTLKCSEIHWAALGNHQKPWERLQKGQAWRAFIPFVNLQDNCSLLFFFFFSPVPFLGKCKKCFSSHHWINYLRINWILFTVQWFYVINFFFLNLSSKLKHFNNIKNLSNFKSPSPKWYG